MTITIATAMMTTSNTAAITPTTIGTTFVSSLSVPVLSLPPGLTVAIIDDETCREHMIYFFISSTTSYL